MGADAAAEEQFGPYLVYERLGVGGMATVHRALERGHRRLRAHRRAQAPAAAPRRGRELHQVVRARSQARVAAQPRQHRPDLRARPRRHRVLHLDGVHRRARHPSDPAPRAQGHRAAADPRHRRRCCSSCATRSTTRTPRSTRTASRSGSSTATSRRRTCSSPARGHLKVIDFGIAKAQSSQLRTQTGRVKGKLAYMAPEAIAGKRDLDARSDLFAAGVIAHELLTARPLFASKNEYQTLLKVQRGDIMPPSTFNQACPPELDAIVLRALARDPDDRFAMPASCATSCSRCASSTSLQTGYRDIAQWLDWAFSLEAPSGGFAAANTRDQSGSGSARDRSRGTRVARRRTPHARPRNRDEDEAVEIAWGGGEVEADGPVVLDDVPDVSDKHLAVQPPYDDGDDDIPTPLPSPGVDADEHFVIALGPADASDSREDGRCAVAAPIRRTCRSIPIRRRRLPPRARTACRARSRARRRRARERRRRRASTEPLHRLERARPRWSRRSTLANARSKARAPVHRRGDGRGAQQVEPALALRAGRGSRSRAPRRPGSRSTRPATRSSRNSSRRRTAGRGQRDAQVHDRARRFEIKVDGSRVSGRRHDDRAVARAAPDRDPSRQSQVVAHIDRAVAARAADLARRARAARDHERRRDAEPFDRTRRSRSR